MKDKLLTKLGYSIELPIKDQYAYIINIVSLLMIASFGTFYVIFVRSTLVNALSLLCLINFLIVFFLLRIKLFKTAKSLLIMAILFQEVLLIFFWFPKETNFNYFFFIVAPVTFFVFSYESKRERLLIITFNVIAVLLLLLSELIPSKSLIAISDKVVTLFSTMSVLSTISSITIVYYLYARSLSKIHTELKVLADTDTLTSIANRRILFEEGDKIFDIKHKYDKNFTVILFDIDYFKRINDTYGHPIGDEILVELTKLVKSNIRQHDLFARYGGEEFAIILKDTQIMNHIRIANLLNDKISNHNFVTSDNQTINFTVSIGVVCYSEEYSNFSNMLKVADEALYEAKSNGRNQVVVK